MSHPNASVSAESDQDDAVRTQTFISRGKCRLAVTAGLFSTLILALMAGKKEDVIDFEDAVSPASKRIDESEDQPIEVEFEPEELRNLSNGHNLLREKLVVIRTSNGVLEQTPYRFFKNANEEVLLEVGDAKFCNEDDVPIIGIKVRTLIDSILLERPQRHLPPSVRLISDRYGAVIADHTQVESIVLGLVAGEREMKVTASVVPSKYFQKMIDRVQEASEKACSFIGYTPAPAKPSHTIRFREIPSHPSSLAKK